MNKYMKIYNERVKDFKDSEDIIEFIDDLSDMMIDEYDIRLEDDKLILTHDGVEDSCTFEELSDVVEALSLLLAYNIAEKLEKNN